MGACPDEGTSAFGIASDSDEHINATARESVQACCELRDAIPGLDHAPAEVVFTRHCEDVSSLMYHIRTSGNVLDHDLLACFDEHLRSAVSASLCGDFPEHCWWQATTGVASGCLGFRTTLSVALPVCGHPHHVISPLPSEPRCTPS